MHVVVCCWSLPHYRLLPRMAVLSPRTPINPTKRHLKVKPLTYLIHAKRRKLFSVLCTPYRLPGLHTAYPPPSKYPYTNILYIYCSTITMFTEYSDYDINCAREEISD